MTGRVFFVLMDDALRLRPDADRIESRNPRFRHLSPRLESEATEHFSHVRVRRVLLLYSSVYLPQNSLDISCSFRVIDHRVHYYLLPLYSKVDTLCQTLMTRNQNNHEIMLLLGFLLINSIQIRHTYILYMHTHSE